MANQQAQKRRCSCGTCTCRTPSRPISPMDNPHGVFSPQTWQHLAHTRRMPAYRFHALTCPHHQTAVGVMCPMDCSAGTSVPLLYRHPPPCPRHYFPGKYRRFQYIRHRYPSQQQRSQPRRPRMLAPHNYNTLVLRNVGNAPVPCQNAYVLMLLHQCRITTKQSFSKSCTAPATARASSNAVRSASSRVAV